MLGGARLKLPGELRELLVERSHRLLGLRELLLGQAQRLLGAGDGGALGVHRARHRIVVDHREHPGEQPAAGFGDNRHRLRVEVLLLGVHAQVLDHAVRDGVLVVLLQALQEVARAQHQLSARPADLLFLLENLHALAHLLHGGGGLGERLDLGDVLLFKVLERLRGSLERRDRLREVILGFLLLHGDARGVHLELLLLRRRRRLLGLHLGGALRDHLQKLVHLHRLRFHLNLRLGQVRLHRRDVGGGLDQLL